MKSTGIIRRIDELGRLVIPKEIRRTMDLPETTPMEIFTDGNMIILQKYVPGCSICDHVEIVATLDNIKLCAMCRDKLIKEA